jgi:hypothetical protein
MQSLQIFIERNTNRSTAIVLVLLDETVVGYLGNTNPQHDGIERQGEKTTRDDNDNRDPDDSEYPIHTDTFYSRFPDNSKQQTMALN